MKLSPLPLAAALACALATPSDARAQSRLATEPHSALAFEAGAFTYERDRYPADFEIAGYGAAGWRWLRRGVFVEPNLRVLVSDRSAQRDCGVVSCSNSSASDRLPILWPGVTGGLTVGNDYASRSFGARLALGVGDVIQPLVGLRYEQSARRVGWFIELSGESVPWFGGERRWSPGLSVGARWWTRHVTVPAPTTLTDAGILPEQFDDRYDSGERRRAAPRAPEPYLMLWAQDADRAGPPFVAMIDVDPASARYRSVVATLPVGAAGENAHHAELTVPDDRQIWVSSFGGPSFLIDVSDPEAPVRIAELEAAPGLAHPHSFTRLEDGNVLVTYQMNETHDAPGGLAVHTPDGVFGYGGSAIDDANDAFVRPYSAAVVPELDRIVTTGADMHETDTSRVVQLWRMRDLDLLRTIELEPGARGTENVDPFEPRVLPDGTVFVVTIGCGLYRIDGVDTTRPRATLAHTFSGDLCFMPALSGFWWIQTVPLENAIEVLDMTQPITPRLVSRLRLPEGFEPHWLATSAAGDRVAVTGYGAMQQRVLLLRFDRTTGAIALDLTFRGDDGAPGIALEGPDGPAMPHAAVFVPASQ